MVATPGFCEAHRPLIHRDYGRARRGFDAEVGFYQSRQWRSVRTGITYPVEWRVRIAQRVFLLQGLMDDQELDSRRSTGAIYWEGLSELKPADGGPRLGLGYLELTGYAGAIRL